MKVISVIVGAVLLGASLFLAFFSSNYETTLKNNKDLISKYCKIANEALDNNDIKKATKYAKMAIVVNPKNKEGFKVLEKIYQVKYKPTINTNTAPLPGMPGLPGAITPITPMPVTPTSPVPEEAEEEDMGC